MANNDLDMNLNEEEAQAKTNETIEDVKSEENSSQETSEVKDVQEDQDLSEDDVEGSDMDIEVEDIEEEDTFDDSEKEGFNFFKKKKAKKDEQQEKIDELTDRLLRKVAEFDNFRKRTEKEKTQMYEIGVKSVVEIILPIVDNFERGLSTVSEDKKEDPFVQGMEQVYKQFLKSLEDIGVKPIEAVGKEFDPNLHNAVMHEDDPEQGENIIIEEFQKGYTYKDSVVRYSMVKVVN